MHASLPDLLEIICGAAEFSGVALRRSEKRQLAGMNKRAAAEGRPFVVAPESLAATSATVKPKKTISTPKEKLLVLVSDALGEQPTESLDYSMRSELDGVLIRNRARWVRTSPKFGLSQSRLGPPCFAVRISTCSPVLSV